MDNFEVGDKQFEEFCKSEDRYHALFNSITDSLLVHWVKTDEAKGTFIEVNDVACHMLGYTREELLGMTPSDIDAPDSGVDVASITQKLQFGKNVLFEQIHIGKDGRRIPVEINSRVFVFNGRPAVISMVRDISMRKRAELELLEGEDKYRRLIETTGTGYVILDDQGRVIDANEEYVHLTGRQKLEDVIDHSVLEWTAEHDHEKNATAVTKCIEQGFIRNLEIDYVTPSGKVIPIEINATVLRASGTLRILTLCRDISERMLAEEEKYALQAQLQQAQKMESVARLAGGVAHDFNNMLGVIIGHVELAMMQVNPAEVINVNLQEIKNAAQRSADLTRQLLAFARRQTAAPKILDLNDRVTRMLKMLQKLIGEDIDLIWMPRADIWPVKIDPAQIDQILANLCVNARDAIAGVGKVIIEIENTTLDEPYCSVNTGFACGQYVMLTVSDNGCGISREVLDHLFEPFFTTKEVGRGTGLGLATVYGIVKQNDGFIKVYSEPGQGTSFKIYLPRFVGEATEPQIDNTIETPKGRGETVLLVEDEAAILNVSKSMLEELGYTVLIAETPAEALRQFKAHVAEIQLLITDVVMPEMNGRDLEKLISEIKPGLKCIFTSGYTANVIAHHGVLDESLHFLQKPFSMDDLAYKVHEALEQK